MVAFAHPLHPLADFVAVVRGGVGLLEFRNSLARVGRANFQTVDANRVATRLAEANGTLARPLREGGRILGCKALCVIAVITWEIVSGPAGAAGAR